MEQKGPKKEENTNKEREVEQRDRPTAAERAYRARRKGQGSRAKKSSSIASKNQF